MRQLKCVCGKPCKNQRGLARHQAACAVYKGQQELPHNNDLRVVNPRAAEECLLPVLTPETVERNRAMCRQLLEHLLVKESANPAQLFQFLMQFRGEWEG